MALLLIAAALGGSEVFWRVQGHAPSIVDDLDLWAAERRKIDQSEKPAIALLGASRIQLGFDTYAFRQNFSDYTLVQLAVNGTSPVAALRDLAEDESFRGIVVCSVTAGFMEKGSWQAQQSYVDHYRRERNLADRLDRQIRTLLQENLVVVNPNVGVWSVLRNLSSGHLPAPMHLTTFPDRSRSADYTKLDIVEHRAARIRQVLESQEGWTPPSPDAWLADLAGIEDWVRRVQGRGGRVVFARLPTTDEHWENSEATFPRRLYWDRFAAMTSAETIHFKDVPTLSSFECPDTSHLDARDRGRFTAALAQELIRRNVLVHSAVADATGKPEPEALAASDRAELPQQ